MSAVPYAKLSDAAFLNPTLGGRLPDDYLVSFVPMASLSAETAKIETTQDRPYSEVAKGFTPFLSGDVLVAKITPCFENGKIAQALLPRRNGFGSTEFHVVRARPNVSDARYLHHYLRLDRVRTEGQRRMTGSGGQRRVPASFLSDLRVPLPPLEEQRRIAAILDQTETLRTQRRQALAHLNTLTQSLFLDMFGDPVANPQRFDVVSLGDICDVRDGTHDSPKYVGEGYPLVTSKNLSSGQVDLSNVNLISAADYGAINRRSKVDRGDLLMPMIGTIGNPVLIDHEPRYAVKNVAIVKFPEGSPSNIFIRAILSGRYFDFVVAQKNRGGTQKFVSLGDLRSFPIPLPPTALQQTFTTRIQAIEALKATHRTALAQLDALFASLQQRAFAGAL